MSDHSLDQQRPAFGLRAAKTAGPPGQTQLRESSETLNPQTTNPQTDSDSQPMGLPNAFQFCPASAPRIQTEFRNIVTELPVPEDAERLQSAAAVFPEVNCYQAPVIWDRAEDYQVFDRHGNCWIDFSSTAVMTNTGHGHPAIREAVAQQAQSGLLAQFSFASDVRIQLAERLVQLAPDHCDKVYFWTVGSEAIECALRLARSWGQTQHPNKTQILTHRGDYHGWTLGAHQLSGQQAGKAWLTNPDAGIHHLPFPSGDAQTDWTAHLDQQWRVLAEHGVTSDDVAAVFIETLQGWGALRLPDEYVQGLRRWADAHNVLLVFDEVQTGFGRTGRWFAHEHYGVQADLICIGKGVTSSLPLAAVLGPSEVLDTLTPGEITTTHAAHPLSCAAALANLDVLENEALVAAAADKQALVTAELEKLQQRFPQFISKTCGLGLLHAIHVTHPVTRKACRRTAAEWTWAAVKQGVMLFHTNQPSVKVCPPLTIPDAAIVEGIHALGDALQSLALADIDSPGH